MQHVSRDALRQSVMTPVICPLPTVVALIVSALSGTDRADDAGEIRGALLAHLRARDVATLLPLRVSDRPDGSGGRPNEVVPVMAGATIDEQLDAVRAIDPDALHETIHLATEAGHPTGAWRAAVDRDPAAWLRAYASALRRAWDVIAPVWSRATDVLERDAERVGVAAARGAGPELVEQVFPFVANDGEDLLLPSHSDHSGRLQVKGTLPLIPLVAPIASSGWTDDYGDRFIALRYSAMAAWSGLHQPPPPASLAALLGPQRARVLRWLVQPTTPGRLADRLHGAPSMVTHHLRALEASGLITRRREGRHVRVARTTRGDELVALYEED